jgi:hypothetical protein
MADEVTCAMAGALAASREAMARGRILVRIWLFIRDRPWGSQRIRGVGGDRWAGHKRRRWTVSDLVRKQLGWLAAPIVKKY